MVRELSDKWAYDIDKKIIQQGEIWDVNVINQSIEMILGTRLGERLFNPGFGYGLQFKIFNIINEGDAELILDEIATALKRWEDRITVIEKDMRIVKKSDENSMIIIIPYLIRRVNLSSVFKKKIYQ